MKKANNYISKLGCVTWSKKNQKKKRRERGLGREFSMSEGY